MRKILAAMAVAMSLTAPGAAEEFTMEQIQRVGFVTAVRSICSTYGYNVQYQPEFDGDTMMTLASYYLLQAPEDENAAFLKGSDGFVDLWKESDDKKMACYIAVTLVPKQLRMD